MGAYTSNGACGSIRCKAKNLTRVWHAMNPLERARCRWEHGHKWYMAIVSRCCKVLG